MKNALQFIQKLSYEFSVIYPARHGAALAYYGVFALAPVIFITIELASFFLGDLVVDFLQETEGLLLDTLGPDVVASLQEMVASTAEQTSEETTLLTIIGILGVLYVGAGAFAQLKFSLNTIWEVPAEKQIGILPFIIARLLGMAVVLGMGLMFVALVLLNLFLESLSSILQLPAYFGATSYFIFVGMIILSFGLLYRFLPDTKITWKDVWAGAVIAGVLIGLGLALVAWFLQNTRFSSALAATGTFIVILISINYVAQIFLFGAVITKVYSKAYGSRIKDSIDAAQVLAD